MRYTTLRYRIKDSTCAKHLNTLGNSVNFVWNYCNEVNTERWQKFRKTYSNYDLHNLTAGCSKELGLNSITIQCIANQYINSCKQVNRIRLAWRSRKKSLGWIPFSGRGVQVVGDTIRYNKKTYKVWLSRPIEGKVIAGSFAQDSQGHWYVNLDVEEGDRYRFKTNKSVGLDLGLKTIATLSDGTVLERQNITRTYEEKLKAAQRAGKKRRVTAIHAKIKSTRKDWNHKITTQLVQNYDTIVIGNVNSRKLLKTPMAKSVSDASWYIFKSMLERKAIGLGVEVKEVNESYSTITCSACKERTGPKGLTGLGVRKWVCSNCHTEHNRDVNAALNILFSVRGIGR